MESLEVGAVFRRAFALYRRRFGMLTLLGAVGSLVVAAAGYEPGARGSLMAGLASLLLGCVYIAVATQAAGDLDARRPDTPFAGLLSVAASRFLPLVGLSLVVVLGVTVGFLLLVVPAVILGLMWAVCVPVLVLERPGVFASLGRSRSLVKGNKGRVLLTFLPLAVATAIIVAITGALVDPQEGSPARFALQWLTGTLTWPISVLISCALYFELRDLAGGPTRPPRTRAPRG